MGRGTSVRFGGRRDVQAFDLVFVMTRSASYVFQAGTAYKDVLDAITWVPLAENPRGVQVQFGDGVLGTSPPKELIGIVGTVDDDNQTHAVFGVVGKDETFTIRTVIRVAQTGLDGPAIWDRLAVLCGQIENAIRSTTTGKPIVPAAIVLANGRGVWKWEIVQVQPTIVPTVEGYDGYCVLDLQVAARI